MAIAYLKHVLADSYLGGDGRKLFLSVEPVETSLSAERDLPAEFRQQFHDDPFYSLYRQLLASNRTDPRTECPSVRRFLAGPTVRKRFTDKEPAPRGDAQWDAIFVGVSLPAVSESGNEAVMLASSGFGPLAGSGREVYLRKNAKGQWVVKYEQSTWVS